MLNLLPDTWSSGSSLEAGVNLSSFLCFLYICSTSSHKCKYMCLSFVALGLLLSLLSACISNFISHFITFYLSSSLKTESEESIKLLGLPIHIHLPRRNFYTEILIFILRYLCNFPLIIPIIKTKREQL
jgi:hypothetical protein